MNLTPRSLRLADSRHRISEKKKATILDKKSGFLKFIPSGDYRIISHSLAVLRPIPKTPLNSPLCNPVKSRLPALRFCHTVNTCLRYGFLKMGDRSFCPMFVGIMASESLAALRVCSATLDSWVHFVQCRCSIVVYSLARFSSGIVIHQDVFVFPLSNRQMLPYSIYTMPN
jgi:hypothetical protein